MTAAARTMNNVRCPSCGASISLSPGDTRLSCTSCGLAAPVSRVGTAPGAALVELEPDLAGATLGGHTIVERIGAGGMGTVYKARGPSGDVAIKVLRPGLGVDRAAVLARFAREAAALRRLDHPRVVRFLDHGQDGDVAFIVTELVDGRDLAARLADGAMPLAETVDIFGQVCDGVAAAHAAGIVHRDLKPANILVGTDGVKVADFGLAQLGPDVAVTTLTRTDVAMGTFHYLAPEQRKDARNVDHRADIWALGVILYEMLTGELPLGSFTPPSDRRAAAIVRRALAPDPAARFSSVTALGSAIRALAPRPPVNRRRLVATLAAIGILGGGSAGAAFAIFSSSSSSSSSPTSSSSSLSPASFASPTYGADKSSANAQASPSASLGMGAGSAARAAAAAVTTKSPADSKELQVDSKESDKPRPTDRGRGDDTKTTVRKPTASKPTASKPTASKRPTGKSKLEKAPASKPPASKAVEPDGDDAADEAAGEDAPSSAGDAPQPQVLPPPRKLSPAELKKLKGKGSK